MYRHLLNAIDEIWRSNACNFVNRGCDVNDVVKLRAQFVGCFDLLRPRNCDCVAGAAKVRRDLFHPLKRRVERPRPTNIEMVLALCGAEIVDMFKQPFWIFGHAVLKRRCTPRAVDSAFGRSAVVAGDVNNQSVFGNFEFI